MTKRMLIDATHAEETRVVVLDGNRLEDFDVETSTKRQLKGNIYLAKVVRVEPSLQACFVEYGGNRHGFLAFSEIHPDYYQIPVADRQRLIDMQEEEARQEEEEADREMEGAPEAAAQSELAPVETGDESGATVEILQESAPEHGVSEAASVESAWTGTGDESGAITEWLDDAASQPEPQAATVEPDASAPPADAMAPDAAGVEPAAAEPPAEPTEPPVEHAEPASSPAMAEQTDAAPQETTAAAEATPAEPAPEPPDGNHTDAASEPPDSPPTPRPRRAQPLIIESDTISGTVEEANAIDESEAPDVAFETDTEHEFRADHDIIPEAPPPETVGGEQDNGEEQRERRMPPRFMRNYKIQEVIRRRQILLVQVVKEERGTKGAALTTYISLAGRFSVLMPNSPRGGGISRKITSAADRRRLKEVMTELEIPKGMGMIVRTAGANRPKAEIKRDCEYLLRLWDDIREHTLKSVAPALIYEEASLIKRAIRDVYSRDIDEIQVDGEDGWRAAHDFMRMLMPSHAKKVQLWRDPSQPLFSRHQVEAQLDGMLQPTVQLRSGGYLVINQTEALVAIDVNSGRSTRERGIEETALRTNLEAADEVARQLRLRDLAGLIVIDLIDMEAKKHNAMVERRIKEALKNDRARIQVGHISHFGLLEMSRQRLRPSLAETSFILCPHCGGTGQVRGTESAAIHVLRGIEEEGGKRRSAEIAVYTPTATALYILNHKRDRLVEIETRYAMHVTITGDDTQISPLFRIERVRAQTAKELPAPAITPDFQPGARPMAEAEPEEENEAILVEDDADEDETDSEETAEEARADDARAEPGETAGEQAERRRRRRRRRRGGRPEEARATPVAAESTIVAEMPEGEPPIAASESDEPAPEAHIEGVPEHAEPMGEDDGRGRRRGRRGGRRRGRREDGEAPPYAAPGADQPDLPPVYIGPTPANPFGGHAFDIFDVLEQAEAQAAARPEPAPVIESVPAPVFEPAAEDPEIVNVGAPEPTASEPKVTEMLSEAVPAPEPQEAAEPKVTNTSAPEPVLTEPVATEPAPADPVPAEPVATEPVATPAFAAPEAANDVTPEPAIKPIIIGSGEEPTERKRGWWKR
ncbi:MAG TPA: Rne/Rng family ribonuclease [Acetobacteraceae bacterium]|jgi:ribonuclease E